MFQKQKKAKNGIILIDSLFPSADINKLFQSFKSIVGFFTDRELSNIRTFDDPNMCVFLSDLRKNSPKTFSAIYDTFLKSSAVRELIFKNNFHDQAAEFLECSAGELYVHGIMFRMDMPGDTRNVYDWHQDSAYDEVNSDPINGVIIWAPLVDTDVENGTLVVCPGSHVEPNHKNLAVEPAPGISRQITTPPEIVAKYKQLSVPVKAGSGLITYANIVHKSGNNSSSKCRFTIIVRFNRATTQDFFLLERLSKSE
jgi:ectoine hydroxylase-related dioxygenase (phytanoyl-CoA dioxygenase family)